MRECISLLKKRPKAMQETFTGKLNRAESAGMYFIIEEATETVLDFSNVLEKCVGSCNALNDLSKRICVTNKTKDLNIHIYNMIARKKWITNLTKAIWCQRKCRFDGKNVIQTMVE